MNKDSSGLFLVLAITLVISAAIVVAAVVLLVVLSRPLRAEPCYERPGPRLVGKPWRWRRIDGRQCWYISPTVLDKDRLMWPEPEPDEPEQLVPPGFKSRWPDPVEALPESLWLDNTPVDRWRGTMSGGGR